MQIRLVAHLRRARGHTPTAALFWREFAGFPISAGAPEPYIAQQEDKLYRLFPEILESKLRSATSRRKWVSLLSLKSRSLKDAEFNIVVRRINYSSLELLLDFFFRSALSIGAREIAELVRELAAAALTETLGGGEFVVEAWPQGDQAGGAVTPARVAAASLLSILLLGLAGSAYAVKAALEHWRFVEQERSALVRERLDQLAKHDAQRAQFLEQVLKFALAEPRGRADPNPGRGGPGIVVLDPRQPPPADDPWPGAHRKLDKIEGLSNEELQLLKQIHETMPRTGGSTFPIGQFVLFGGGNTIDFRKVGDGVSKLDSDKLTQLFKGIREGIAAGSDLTKLAREVWELYQDITKKGGGTPPLPPSAGTLLDRQVNFDLNSDKLDAGSEKAIRELASTLAGTSKNILIEGHTDDRGSDRYNRDLSIRRAVAVRRLLRENGVAESRIHIQGYGKGYFWRPFMPTDDQNRRVRIIECVIGDVDRCANLAGSKLTRK